jgi:cytosine/adenosine deaminase-related metal-dependent hydrolase
VGKGAAHPGRPPCALVAAVKLRGARVALGPEETADRDIEVHGRGSINLDGMLLLPGLINAHDHLEFSLYPRLGRGLYANAGAWARDIYHPDRSPLKEQCAIPKRTRLIWGGIRNLLSGVTTVCHHNPWEPAFERNFPVRVCRRFGWAHSLEFSPDLAERFHRAPPTWPFILHLGEGTDRKARREIFELDRLGALDHRTVMAHAVAVVGSGLHLLKQRGASILWCPSSNLFLLKRTLNRSTLESGAPIAIATDSPLTAKGDLLDEIRVAHKSSGLAASRIYDMVTETPARILKLPRRRADWVAIRSSGRSPCEALLRASRPELVVVRGKLRLISAELARQARLPRFERLHVEGRGEFLVDADIARLRKSAERFLGNTFRLGGKRVLA